MKVRYIKGLNAAGILLMTLQLLVYLFEYVVNTDDWIKFILESWAGVLGFVLLLGLFVKNRLDAEFILTLIGVLMWAAQFFVTFSAFDKEFMSAFLYSSAGILGNGFILIGLILYTATGKKEKHQNINHKKHT